MVYFRVDYHFFSPLFGVMNTQFFRPSRIWNVYENRTVIFSSHQSKNLSKLLWYFVCVLSSVLRHLCVNIVFSFYPIIIQSLGSLIFCTEDFFRRWNMINVWVSMIVISQIDWQLKWIEVARTYHTKSGEWRMPLPISTQSCPLKAVQQNSCFKSLEIHSNWHCWINNYACDRFFCHFMSKTFMIYLKMFFFSLTIFRERKRQSLIVWNWANSPLFEPKGFEVNT